MKPFVPPTDWRPRFTDLHPAFATIRAAAEPFVTAADWPSLDAMSALFEARAVRTDTGARLRAVPQPARRGRNRAGTTRSLTELYDSQITLLGEIPTRARSWHDLFGALVWATFPSAKSALSGRQHRGHSLRLGQTFTALPNARTREQDTLALLDEGSVLLLCQRADAESLTDAVQRADHPALTRMLRENKAFSLVFGHAIYEHLVAGDDRCHAMPALLVSDAPIPDAIEARAATADRLLAARLRDLTDFTVPSGVSAVPMDAR